MCGISACLVKDKTAMRSVIDSLNKLQNRGYDSVGVCTIKNGNFIIRKFTSESDRNAIDYIKSDSIVSIKCNLAIGHTRWATHGQKILENAHPHTDNDMRFSLIHNGIIDNYLEIKEELIRNGYSFYGQTDTEVVVKYLSHLIKNNCDYTDLGKHLEGTWAIIFLDRMYPDRIYFTKNGSPLIFGYNKSKIMFVSEINGFDPDIENYFILNDLDCGYASLTEESDLDRDICFELKSTKKYQSISISKFFSDNLSFPYLHWTLKEINDQPNSITDLLSSRISYSNTKDHQLNLPELDTIKDELKGVQHIIFLGCGTSYHSAQMGAKFFKELRTTATVEVIDGADFEERDLPLNMKTIMILLSQSGETRDLYRALLIGKQYHIRTIGIINVEHSLIAREVDVCLLTKAGRENAVASTKSFTNQVIMLLLLAIWMNSGNSDVSDYFSALYTLADEYLEIIRLSENFVPNVLSLFKDHNDCFILGKHFCEWTAKEGALKIKEISYIHAEGYSASALKHGPFALLTNNIPIILLDNDDNYHSKIENVAAEVKSRRAKVICISNKSINSENIDYVFYFNTDSVLFPLMSVVPLQILAYYLSLDKGINPDYPRNLAKVVTVE